MKKLLMTFLTLVAITVSSLSSAAIVWTGPKDIATVEVVQDGGFLIGFTTSISASCTAAGTYNLYIYSGQGGMTIDGVKAQLAVALTAISTGMKVTVMYDDASPNCWGTYIVLTK